MAIKKICDCGSTKIDIFSAVEKKIDVKNDKVSIVEITYICQNCGSIEEESAYLYKNNI